MIDWKFVKREGLPIIRRASRSSTCAERSITYLRAADLAQTTTYDLPILSKSRPLRNTVQDAL
jgi:hypothetical protein